MLGWKGEYARGNAEISDEHAQAESSENGHFAKRSAAGIT